MDRTTPERKAALRKLMTETGARLEISREALGLSQREFSERVGLGSSGYNHYEQGKRLLPVLDALAICLEYKLTLEWLYKGDASNIPYELGNAIMSLQRVRKTLG